MRVAADVGPTIKALRVAMAEHEAEMISARTKRRGQEAGRHPWRLPGQGAKTAGNVPVL